jgi:hypothetical protein
MDTAVHDADRSAVVARRFRNIAPGRTEDARGDQTGWVA